MKKLSTARNSILGLTTAVALTLTLSACVSGSVESTGDNDTEIPQSIVDSGVLRVGTTPLIGLPWTAVDEETNENIGIDAEIARALGAELGLDVEFVNLSFESLIPSLEASRIDIIVSDMLDTAERQGAIDFVDYVLGGDGLVMLYETDGDPKSLEELCGYSVGVLRGAIAHISIEEVECPSDNQIDLQVFPDTNTELSALDSGRIDVASGDPSIWGYMVLQNPERYKIAGQMFNAGPLGIGVAKDSSLSNALVEALNSIIESGEYAEIMKSWGMPDDVLLNEATINAGS